MSPDIDDLLRTTMRRHAADAPTRIDLDAVRVRSRAITRRRRYEAATAVITTLALLLGLGYAASQLRTDATPVEPVPADGLPWVAFPTFDPNGQPHGATSIVIRSGVGLNAVAAPGTTATVLGWYGSGARTLVYTAGTDGGLRESALMAVTVSEDGRQVGQANELDVPGLGTVTGRAFAVKGEGPVVWVPTDTNGAQGKLVKVSADLSSADTVALPPGEPLFVTAGVVGLGSAQSRRIELVSTATGQSTGSFTMCPQPNYQVAVSYDGTHVALSCGDGTVQLVNLGGPTNPHLPVVPDAAGRGGFLGLWFDPAGGLHASTTPEMQASYSVVNDFDYDGVSWNAAGSDVLTRVFPATGLHVDLAYHAQKWAYTPHWVVTQPRDVDLGETTGTAIAFRTETEGSPTPTPSPSTQALPPAPSTPPWTASVRDVPAAAPPRAAVEVTIDGRTREIDPGDNAATEIAGWTGPDRRTLVWGYTQDYPGDQGVRTATFAADGSLASGPTTMKAPDGTDLVGHPVVLPDGRLVVWRFGSNADRHVQGTLLRYSADLTSATTQKLPVGDLVFVTSDYVGVQDAQYDPSALTVVATAGGDPVRITLASGSCATGWRASTNATGDLVAVSCEDTQVQVIAPAQAANVGVQTLAGDLPEGSRALATWFTPTDELRASTRADDGTVSTWRWEPAGPGPGQGRWVPTATQGVAFASYVDGYAVELVATKNQDFTVSGTWRTGTDPSLDLGTGSGFASLVARPAG